MKAFIVNPIEPETEPIYKTKVVSILFDKSRWKNKLEEMSKWVKSRFKTKEPNIEDGDKYYHIRVAPENKENQKRVIDFSVEKGIKAIIELVPVNFEGVYYTEDVDETVEDDYNYDVDKEDEEGIAMSVGRNIKVTPEIREFIMKNANIPSGTLVKMIRDKFGMELSPTTINRYRKGIVYNKSIGEDVEVEYLGNYDRSKLMSVARVGDKLFMVLNTTGEALGEILYKGGEYILKKGKKLIKLNNKAIECITEGKKKEVK